MAKVKAPLFGLGASGKLGNALVYFPWKGIDVVREYVVPTNPRSTAQQTQRGHLRESVIRWHGLNFTEADRIAWNGYAGTLAKIMSGFNAFMRLSIASEIAAVLWGILSDVQVDTPTAVGFDVDVENSMAGYTLRARIGTSKTFYPTPVALVDDTDGTYSLTWAAGVKSQTYYVKIEQQIGAIWYQRTGIYQVKTTA